MELIIIFTAIFIAVIACSLSRRRGAIEFISAAAALVAFIESIFVALRVAAAGIYAPNQIFSVDALGAIIVFIISLVGLAASFYSVFYLREETAKGIVGFKRVKQYFILLNLFFAAMFLAVVSSSPIIAWISIEATTLSTAFLISFYNKPTSMEAAWKYLIINSVGLLLGFFGTLLYLTSLKIGGGADPATWSLLLSNAAHFDPMIAKIAFVFVLVGYGTKIGLAPMHTWLPDAHSKAPVPISALLSGVLLNVAFLALLRFKAITDIAVGADFSGKLLIAFGLLSVFIAVFIIFGQRSYKRLLAYSSIENMGIMALGFGFGGLGVLAAIFHLLYHSLLKAGLFLSAGNIFLKYSSTKISKVKGALAALPITGILFLLGFFAIVGTPPFGIFFTKIFIFSAGMPAYPIISMVAIFLTAILFVGFFKHVTAMMFGERPPEIKAGKENIWLILPPLALIVIVLCFSFYLPPFLQKLITLAASGYK